MSVPSAASQERKSITVDIGAFTRTRDALAAAYIGLSEAIDKSVKAYVEHTNTVIKSDATLNVSYLTQPFDQLAHTAQLAQQALNNGLSGAQPKSEDVDGNTKGKRKKRAYKQRDPNAPKRPLTAYFRYLQEQRGPLGKELAERAEGTTQKPGDLSREATSRWHALGKEEQQPYKEAYQRALKAYEIEVAKYRADGGALEDGAAVEGADDEEVEDAEGEMEEEARSDTKAVVDEDEDEDTSSDESSDEEEEKEPTPPPPPPPPAQKTPKSALKKSKAAAAVAAPTPQFSSINPAQAVTKVSSSPERKRKVSAAATDAAAAAAAEEPAKKKRGRKPNAEKVTAGADTAANPEEVVTTAASEPVKGKKKRVKKGE
ncbi:hypothetical protein LTR62_003133 [Meristemomyces frigidus]|uniref:HMG box domain-containing protein n=1 Tax=Meristemomyces frigidus TaxID=1508187 RepID=A0AAN7YH96_9PEZI|nr:hypothetical protein LTR62_003133 [Meristemomyces frigidus]